MNKRVVVLVSIAVIVGAALGTALAVAITASSPVTTTSATPEPTVSPDYPDFAVSRENLPLARNVYDNCLVTGAQLLAPELHYRLPDACHADALLQAGELSFVEVSESGLSSGGSLDAETGQLRVWVPAQKEREAQEWAEQFGDAVVVLTTLK